MSATLTPDLEARIQETIASGSYSSRDEVVTAALEALDEREKQLRLRELIAAGDAAIAHGEVVEFTDDLLDDIDREVDERLLRGELPSPHVCS